MYGLRLINNNYVANGTGKDVTITYDPTFRGGRLGSVNQLQHFPNPKAGAPKRRKDENTGFNQRDEAYKQTLNCSRSAFLVRKDAKERIKESAKFRFSDDANKTLGTVLSLKSLPASRELIRATSAPSFQAAAACNFRPRWDVPAMALDEAVTSQEQAAEEVKRSLLPSYWRPKDPALDWPAPGFLHPTTGFSRTDGGGPWPN
ncbi:unnamed protein product [Effrenium voratum]|nr:unnamed protein product [Effrenium voratum]|mmetsp:Transcript_33299/g.79859  ORF Transcript_33299/g.79859 Transcript_33299/m.79859 type:complete len:203 (+) Transcript_33299:29-637(+)